MSENYNSLTRDIWSHTLSEQMDGKWECENTPTRANFNFSFLLSRRYRCQIVSKNSVNFNFSYQSTFVINNLEIIFWSWWKMRSCVSVELYHHNTAWKLRDSDKAASVLGEIRQSRRRRRWDQRESEIFELANWSLRGSLEYAWEYERVKCELI